MSRAVEAFRVPPGARVSLADWPTRVPGKSWPRPSLEARIRALDERQTLLYADNRQSLLVILQGMDSAGKDSAIKHVMSGVNPQGCQVVSFKHPGSEALDHDFLWRTTLRLPERGMIGLFNRSYYEEVLIVRVQRALLRAERLPEDETGSKRFWRERFHSINALERHLVQNGTRVIKFFLHLSKAEQRVRLMRRIEDPKRQWKINQADVDQRLAWKDYQRAYEACLSATSTREAPWYVVPADHKPDTHHLVSQLIIETLDSMQLRLPKVTGARRRELKALARALDR